MINKTNSKTLFENLSTPEVPRVTVPAYSKLRGFNGVHIMTSKMRMKMRFTAWLWFQQ